MAAYLWIAVGSALGGVARFWCSGVAARFMGETFPWGTIIDNVVDGVAKGDSGWTRSTVKAPPDTVEVG